ncbi:MAG: hypothetical protein RBR86_02160 [Pseudobdellovibrionaceae bacterium]|jgi:hypothetical protein|nr:hypothetical protein [Pseudobdellovibrionaceae bacterium]
MHFIGFEFFERQSHQNPLPHDQKAPNEGQEFSALRQKAGYTSPMYRAPIQTLALTTIALMLASCSSPSDRLELATRIAASANLDQRTYTLPDYTIKSWSRITDQEHPVNIYIEGDGFAWVNKNTPSRNPTPKNPIGLKLASIDPSPNVIYLARPCQFLETGNMQSCKQQDWTSARFSMKIINTYNLLLNQISPAQDGQKFNLIGFSGGANIAGLLASRRNDILSLRTVAGNIDNTAFTKYHHVTSMPESMDVANYTKDIHHIPQIHFVGEKDTIIPPQIASSYLEKTPDTQCIKVRIIPDISHTQGWETVWPELLKIPANCAD